MPEGDSVYRACADLHEALAGRVVQRADLRVPRLATAGTRLEGQTIEGVIPHGKHLLMRIGDHTLHSHLGMDGAWRIRRPGSAWPAPSHEVRAVIETAEQAAIGTLLPVLELLARDREHEATGHLGPDLLDRAWNDDLAATAAANLRADTSREIAEALLDQRVLAGLGNVYVTELCFLHGVRPKARIDEAGDADALVALARRLLYANRLRPHQRVFTGVDRARQRTWVYGREGQPCRRCGTRIEAGRHGAPPDTRRSAWCPRCQPEPRAA